jgi:hypothetical protein
MALVPSLGLSSTACLVAFGPRASHSLTQPHAPTPNPTLVPRTTYRVSCAPSTVLHPAPPSTIPHPTRPGPICGAGLVQCDEEAKRLYTEAFGIATGTSNPQQFSKFKYMVVVDGNGPPASRSDKVLLGDTVPLWQESEQYEFFYKALAPYVHYIPLAAGLEDLYSKIEWARAHPEACKRIVQEGQAFGRRYFNSAFADLYILTLLQEYAKLMRFTPALTDKHRLLEVTDAMQERLSRSAGGCKYRVNAAPAA